MATLGATLSGAFLLVTAFLYLSVAAFLVALPSGRAAKFAMAAFVAIVGIGTGIGGVRTLGDPAAWWYDPLTWLERDFIFFGAAGGLAFAWMYPSRPRAASLRFALLAIATAFLATQLVVHFAARDWVFDGGRTTVQWHVLGPYGEVGTVLTGLAVVASFLAADRLDDASRRGAKILFVGILFGLFIAPGKAVVWWASDLLGGPGFAPSALAAVQGDPLRVSAAAWLIAWIVLPLGVAAQQSIARRYHPPLAFVAAGALMGILTLLQAEHLGFVFGVLTAMIPAYAVARHGAFGVRHVPPGAGYLVAAAVATASFFLASIAFLAIDPANPLLLAAGILVGLVLAVASVFFVLPRARAWGVEITARASPDSTHQRLGPYRAVLATELDSGATQADVFARLKPLRSTLGVSDHEHNVLEYALRAAPEGAISRGVAPGRTLLGRYRVKEVLRSGGAGVTHLCHDERVDRNVVIKTLRSPEPGDDGLGAVLREARALAKVRHPNVVTLLDVEQIGGEALIVMEHVEGGSLADRLAKRPLEPAEWRALARDLLSAIGAVHSAGLVHRDVKPSNVLLTREGRAKLADFGIAHIAGFETTAAQQAGGAGAVGTIRYMSPEQARGRAVGPRSDLFSAAATLYEASTGAPYLEAAPAESAVELQMRAASLGPFDRPTTGPAALRAWWARALAPTPGERYQSAGEMLAGLERALG